MIRALETLDDFRAVEELQQKVWNVADREIVPALPIPVQRLARFARFDDRRSPLADRPQGR